MTSYVIPPDTSKERSRHKEWLVRNKRDIDQHITGSRMKRMWSSALLRHYKWWKNGREGVEPSLLLPHAVPRLPTYKSTINHFISTMVYLRENDNALEAWSRRSLNSGSTKFFTKNVKRINSLLAGGDDEVVPMLQHTFPGIGTDDVGIEEMGAISGVIMKLFTLVGKPGFNRPRNEAYTMLKHTVLDILMELPLGVRKNLGYRYGETTTKWQCNQSNKRKSGAIPISPGKQGRHKLIKKKKQISPDWHAFLALDKNTQPGRRNVFDSIGADKQKIAVRNLKRPMDEVALSFITQENAKCKDCASKSWLKGNVPRHIKPAILESFACPFCKARTLCAKIMNKMLFDDGRHRRAIAETSLVLPDIYVSMRDADDPIITDQSWKQVILPENYAKFECFIEDLIAFRWHKVNAKHTRKQDRDRRANHPFHKISVIFDFKKGIDTNVEAVQTADQKRNQSLLSYFNMTLEYRDEAEEEAEEEAE